MTEHQPVGRDEVEVAHEALIRHWPRLRQWLDQDRHAGWVVTLSSPAEQDFFGKTLEEVLAWCLVWLMAPELGIGPFRA